jgi:uncharacterized SAM-binding protein YcdF (DUF218 family)
MIKWLIIIPLGLILFIGGISFYLQPNNFIGCGDAPTEQANCQKADAIVAVSGGDTNARTDEAIKLYKNGWADTLIFSGAAQDKSGLSNAAAMQARAIAFGVPSSAIEIDESSQNTEQNAQNTQSILEKDNIHTVILVTSSYHQRRASLEFNRSAGSGVLILNHPTDDSDWSMWWWITPRGWWLAGGELVKIAIFYAHG